MQGQHNGKMVDLFNWPKFRLTKSVFFRATAVNRGTHVYPCMSKGYLQPLVFFIFIFWCHICASKFMHAYFRFHLSRWRQSISGYYNPGQTSWDTFAKTPQIRASPIHPQYNVDLKGSSHPESLQALSTLLGVGGGRAVTKTV